MTKIGKKLKELREKTGYSQLFVAKELGISRQAIISIEMNKRKVDSYELFKFLKLYGIKFEDLFSDKIPKSVTTHNKLKSEIKFALYRFESICKDYEYLKKLT